jgi:hypothetical protein
MLDQRPSGKFGRLVRYLRLTVAVRRPRRHDDRLDLVGAAPRLLDDIGLSLGDVLQARRSTVVLPTRHTGDK